MTPWPASQRVVIPSNFCMQVFPAAHLVVTLVDLSPVVQQVVHLTSREGQWERARWSSTPHACLNTASSLADFL